MKLLKLIVSILILAVGVSTLFIAFQSAATTDVIEHSLSRHVDIFLLERTTYAIVMSELNSQNTWLWLSGFTLTLAALTAFLPNKK